MRKLKSEIVRKGYNKIAKNYHKQRKRYPSIPLLKRYFLKEIPKNSKILDLGCGSGFPVSKFLAEKGHEVTGVDFSKSMINLARKNVPKGKFILGDITKLKLNANSYDGAVSFYAIIHIPKERHKLIYKNLHKILKPSGVIFFNASGTGDWEETTKDYMGVPMFWSFYSEKETLKMIKKEGFKILWSKVLNIGNETQFWVMARNIKLQSK